MEGTPFREPRPSERRVINNSQQEPPARLQFSKDTPRPQGANSSARPTKAPRRRRSLRPIGTAFFVLLIIAAIAAAGWFVLTKLQNTATGIDPSKYQAITLVDGQNYFGKLTDVNSEYMKMTSVYYLQPQQASDTTEGAQSSNQNFKLVKFTDVVYGPEDEIMIRKDNILFYENLDPNGKVAQGIAQIQ